MNQRLKYIINVCSFINERLMDLFDSYFRNDAQRTRDILQDMKEHISQMQNDLQDEYE